ncbi:uncharacterized protein TNCV_2783061 [Trichonephila clavipes]|nr:uncharacterized protein TNCV_2783061 [Trichonephila clavipes]
MRVLRHKNLLRLLGAVPPLQENVQVWVSEIAMKLQKRMFGDQYSEQVSQYKRHAYENIMNQTSEATGRRNHLDDFTRGRLIGKLEEGRTVTSVAAEFGINKRVSFRALAKRFKPQVQLLEMLVVAARGRKLQRMTDISFCRRKEADSSQPASLLSNFLQQRGDKCRGLLWPDAFTKGTYSPAVLKAASR